MYNLNFAFEKNAKLKSVNKKYIVYFIIAQVS